MLHEKVYEVKNKKEKIVEKKRLHLEKLKERMKKADENRQKNINDIVKKAKDDDQKVTRCLQWFHSAILCSKYLPSNEMAKENYSKWMANEDMKKQSFGKFRLLSFFSKYFEIVCLFIWKKMLQIKGQGRRKMVNYLEHTLQNLLMGKGKKQKIWKL